MASGFCWTKTALNVDEFLARIHRSGGWVVCDRVRGGLRAVRGRRGVVVGVPGGSVAVPRGRFGVLAGGGARALMSGRVFASSVSAGRLSGGGGERADAVEGADVVAVPGPAGGQVQCPAARVAGQAAGELEQSAAQGAGGADGRVGD